MNANKMYNLYVGLVDFSQIHKNFFLKSACTQKSVLALFKVPYNKPNHKFKLQYQFLKIFN